MYIYSVQGKPKRQGIVCRVNVIRCPRGLRPMGFNASRPIVPDIFFYSLLRYLARECGEYRPQRCYFCNGTRKRDDKIFIIIQGVTAGVTKVARLPESCRFAFHEHPGAVSRRAYQGSSSYLLSHGAFWIIKII